MPVNGPGFYQTAIDVLRWLSGIRWKPVDWRYKFCELAVENDNLAKYVGSRKDKYLKQLFILVQDIRQALRARESDALIEAILNSKANKYVKDAYLLYEPTNYDASTVLNLQCGILAGLSDNEISKLTGIDDKIILYFRKCFFDIDSTNIDDALYVVPYGIFLGKKEYNLSEVDNLSRFISYKGGEGSWKFARAFYANLEFSSDGTLKNYDRKAFENKLRLQLDAIMAHFFSSVKDRETRELVEIAAKLIVALKSFAEDSGLSTNSDSDLQNYFKDYLEKIGGNYIRIRNNPSSMHGDPDEAELTKKIRKERENYSELNISENDLLENNLENNLENIPEPIVKFK